MHLSAGRFHRKFVNALQDSVTTLTRRWVNTTEINKIDIHRRENYGWVLWIFVDQRPVPASVLSSLSRIVYDAIQHFPALQYVQINELEMLSVETVVQVAARTALLSYRREPL